MIRRHTIVSFHYVLKNSKDETLEDKQTTYLHGSTAISPNLQAQLEGLKAGEKKRLKLKKGEDEADDDYTFDVTIHSIRKATPEELEKGAPLIPMKIHLLSGFLGSGKTTAIQQACRYLQKKNISVAVITNDQGARLVDGDLFTSLGIPAGQVTNGCFCCNYNDLDAAIRYLAKHNGPGVIFAESVGSCADLIATVLKPILRQHPEWQPTVSVFADAQMLEQQNIFDPAVQYIYGKQLEEAPLIVVTKTDLHKAPALNYPDKTILYQNSFNEEDIARWLQTLETQHTTSLPSLTIDYDLYGAGEAKLAWLDQELEINAPKKNAQDAALSLIAKIAEAAAYPIGHLKFLLDGRTKISYTATGITDKPIGQKSAHATLLINARVQTDPETLSNIIETAIKNTEKEQSCKIKTLTKDHFQPGYPRPTHRIA